MGIRLIAYCPHPPIIVPEVGGERGTKAGKTVAAMKSLMQELGQAGQDKEPDTIICITPHGPVFQDAVSIWRTPLLEGTLGKFGAPQMKMTFANDLELTLEIIKEAERERIMTAQLDDGLAQSCQIDLALDHGILVPLSFFPTVGDGGVKLVAISIGLLPWGDLYRFGMAIRAAIHRSGRRVGVIVSGDLSHRLTVDAPGGFHPKGKEFDQLVVSLLEKEDVAGLFALDQELVETAGECGFRPMIMTLGLLDKHRFSTRVLSYEGPFGVGYLVARIDPGELQEQGRLEQLLAVKQARLDSLRGKESLPVKLARRTVEQVVKGGMVDTAPEIISQLDVPKGVFVSIKKNGQLRGCIGTVEPKKANATYEIAANAVEAAMRDPRFEPVEEGELDELEYSVDVLASPEPIRGKEELNPAVYGVVVKAGLKKGLLLPDLPGVETAAQQVAIAKQKAGIGKGEQVKLYRFKVTRYT
jgi:AmmeMemoRadiSam system protein A